METPTKILITGATGFTGEHILREFIKRRDRYEISIFVRTKEKVQRLSYDALPIEIHYGDVADSEALSRSLAGVSTLVDTVPLSLGHADNITAACRRSGTRRLIVLGNTSIFTTMDAGIKSVILNAERCIQTSRLDYTILRPTMIFGTSRDQNMSRLISFLRRFPLAPIPGSGNQLHQPVYVEDVARAVLQAASSPQSVNKEYNIAGRSPLTFNAMINTISGLLGRRNVKVHIPYWLCYAFFFVCESLSLLPSIRLEQVKRLNQDKTFCYESARNDFGFAPLDFEAAIQRELEQLLHPRHRENRG
jgi:nucleoside-diphosphate-sugar epimerase